MFTQNKYTNLYFKIVNNAQSKLYDCYTETHHIIPRCLGGLDDKTNLVKLNAREHFLAHYLLMKMNNSKKLIYAFKCMCEMDPHKKRYYNSRLYAYKRNLFKDTISKSMKNYTRTEEHQKKLSDYSKKRFTETKHAWFNDSINEYFYPVDDERTNSLKIGRITTKSRKWFNDGHNELFLHVDDIKTKTLKLGRLSSSTNKNKIVFNDGIRHYRFHEDDPRIKELKLVKGKIVEQDKFAKNIVGKLWYNNGIRSFRLLPEDPKVKDLVKGRLH